MNKRTDEVFGISADILQDSYVDRGALDDSVQKYLRRKYHVVIRGASKTGKSWLRQKAIPNSIVVQCRLGKTCNDIYTESLGQLGIKLIISESSGGTLKGSVEAESEFGMGLLAKVKAKLSGGGGNDVESSSAAAEAQRQRFGFRGGDHPDLKPNAGN